MPRFVCLLQLNLSFRGKHLGGLRASCVKLQPKELARIKMLRQTNGHYVADAAALVDDGLDVRIRDAQSIRQFSN
mgnify:FL=1